MMRVRCPDSASEMTSRQFLGSAALGWLLGAFVFWLLVNGCAGTARVTHAQPAPTVGVGVSSFMHDGLSLLPGGECETVFRSAAVLCQAPSLWTYDGCRWRCSKPGSYQ